MPKPRAPENRGLPARWQRTHGAYYYRVPPAAVRLWDGKKRFRLGASLAEAHRTYAERLAKGDAPAVPRTLGEAFDWFELNIIPLAKSPATADYHRHGLRRLRPVFAKSPILPFKPAYVYAFVASAKHKVAAHRAVETLSKVYREMVKKGWIDARPWGRDEVRLEGEPARTRDVEDWEIVEAMALEPVRKAGSVLMVQAYLRLKLLTGLAQADMLRLSTPNFTVEGIKVKRHKTANSTGKTTIYTWTDELRAAVERCKAVRPALSPSLFCNRRGESYVNEETGRAPGFKSMWQRFMVRVLAETKVEQHFTEHDLRAYVGSNAESLERARALLQHIDARTTARVYRRKPERVMPTR